jgi:nucleoside-diphosphate-sugar epimerase
MKVVITGHCNGIGKALCKKFSDNGHEVVGFDLENGYDVTDPVVRETIANELLTSDVFINNVVFEQLEMLKKACNVWNGLDKVLINIGSAVVYGNPIKSDIVRPARHLPLDPEYIVAKKELSNFIASHNSSYVLPKIMDVVPGWVDTKMADERQADQNIRMSPDVLSEIVYNNFLYWDQVRILKIVLVEHVKN